MTHPVHKLRTPAAGFGAAKTIEDFVFDHQPGLNRATIAHLATGAFLAKAENVRSTSSSGRAWSVCSIKIVLWQVWIPALPVLPQGGTPSSDVWTGLAHEGWQRGAGRTLLVRCWPELSNKGLIVCRFEVFYGLVRLPESFDLSPTSSEERRYGGQWRPRMRCPRAVRLSCNVNLSVRVCHGSTVHSRLRNNPTTLLSR